MKMNRLLPGVAVLMWGLIESGCQNQNPAFEDNVRDSADAVADESSTDPAEPPPTMI